MDQAPTPFEPAKNYDPFCFAPQSERDVMVKAWNIMGAEVDWSALESVADMLGVQDIEKLIACCVAIRTFNAREQ